MYYFRSDMPQTRYTTEQRTFIVLTMSKCPNNPAIVQRKFEQEFDIPAPSRLTLSRIWQKFSLHGKVTDLIRGRSGRKRSVRTAENEDDIVTTIESDEKVTIRRMALSVAASRSSIHRMLKDDLKFKAYHMSRVQKLTAAHKVTRKECCEMFLTMDIVDDDLRNNLIFTDEALFHLDGHVNTRNSVFWAANNPRKSYEHLRDTPKVVVWVGIHASGVIGPFFFDETSVNQHNYCHLIEHVFYPALPQRLKTHGIFQQDGAAAHTALQTRALLNTLFPRRWIGKYGPTPWPANSPDLTIPDFFAWGYTKDIVYQRPVANLQQLRERIVEAFARITPDMCRRAMDNAFHRFQVCIDEDGGHVEPQL